MKINDNISERTALSFARIMAFAAVSNISDPKEVFWFIKAITHQVYCTSPQTYSILSIRIEKIFFNVYSSMYVGLQKEVIFDERFRLDEATELKYKHWMGMEIEAGIETTLQHIFSV